MVGLCPFHQEKSGSFNVVPHKNIFHCFGCGVGGDCFKFLQLSRGLSFYEAIKELADQVGIEVEDKQLTPADKQRHQQRTSLYDVCSEASRFFHTTLMTRPEGRPALDYLLGRGITEETIKAFQLGFAPAAWDAVQKALGKKGFSTDMAARAGLVKWRSEADKSRGCYDVFRGRVMVPIVDARGKVVAFGGRVLEAIAGTSDAIHADAPKYLNSPETDIYKKSRVLFGLHQARRAVQNRDRLLVVEGYFDVISLHQAGFEETVATCGTALTEEHSKLIRPLTRRVVALFDSDEAGLRAAERSMPIFVRAGIEPYRLTIADAKDPDEFIQHNGPEAFTEALEQSTALFELLLERARKKYGASPQGKQQTVEDLAPIIRLFESAARSAVIGRVSSALAIGEGVITEWVGRARSPSISVDAIPTDRRNWRGSKALNQLFWLLIHHNDLVAPEVVEADPDPDVITDYPPAKQAFALLIDGREVTEVLDFIQDESLRAVLLAAASMDSLIPADKVVNAAKQNLDTLEIRHIDEALRGVEQAIATCNISDDESSYFSLLRNRQALQQRKDEIKRRFAR
jgi:DNA primase